MTGEITYGGRVTDDWDRVLLMTTLNNFYTSDIFASSRHQFTPVENYYAPEHSTIDEVRNYISQLPEKEETEVYGLHPNSEISYMRAESQLILDAVLSVQPRIVPKKKVKSTEE
jgi:dynein heavy chain